MTSGTGGDRAARAAGATVSRRAVLRWSGGAGMMAIAAAALPACTPGGETDHPDADENGVILPPGFRSRIIARAGERVPGTGLEWRAFPDGAATFVDAAVAGGWYLTVNHEIPAVGGVSSLRFAPDGTIVEAHSICRDTAINCAGGATPWGTWLTCEEWDGGHVWECDPTGVAPQRRHWAMGAFAHEAAAVASDDCVYLTEDRKDGGFYRYTPAVPGDLSQGLLEIATAADRSGDPFEGPITWAEVPDPNPAFLETPCREQLTDTIHFDGGEGVATDGDLVWFSTKGDDRIWEYSIADGSLRMRYQAGGSTGLDGVDNLWFDGPSRGVLVAEDGGDMQVVLLRSDDTVLPIVTLPDQDHSEITGPCFSPDGQRLYFSSQRAPVGVVGLPLGITYEITGPFDELLGRV